MRVLLLALVPLAAVAQPAAPVLQFDVGIGIGSARESDDGFAAAMATASVRSGWATGQVRGQTAALLFGSSRWEVAGLVGPTLAGPVGRAFVGAGLGVAGGEEAPGGPCPGFGVLCGSRGREALDRVVGLALAAEGAVRVRSGVWLALRGDANVNGPRTLTGGSVGVRVGF